MSSAPLTSSLYRAYLLEPLGVRIDQPLYASARLEQELCDVPAKVAQYDGRSGRKTLVATAAAFYFQRAFVAGRASISFSVPVLVHINRDERQRLTVDIVQDSEGKTYGWVRFAFEAARKVPHLSAPSTLNPR